MSDTKLPDGWRVAKLSEIGDISSGGTPDTNNMQYWNGNIPWITPTEITKLKTRFIYQTERNITKDGLTNSSAKLLPINSILVCTRATIGEIGINKVPISTNQGFKNIIVNKSNNPDFIYFLLKQNKHKIIEKASGSTFLEISKYEFENLSFILPPFHIQQRIAAILSKADEEVRVYKEITKKLEERNKGLSQKLLSGEINLTSFNL